MCQTTNEAGKSLTSQGATRSCRAPRCALFMSRFSTPLALSGLTRDMRATALCTASVSCMMQAQHGCKLLHAYAALALRGAGSATAWLAAAHQLLPAPLPGHAMLSLQLPNGCAGILSVGHLLLPGLWRWCATLSAGRVSCYLAQATCAWPPTCCMPPSWPLAISCCMRCCLMRSSSGSPPFITGSNQCLVWSLAVG